MRWDYPPLDINPIFPGLGEIIIGIIIIINIFVFNIYVLAVVITVIYCHYLLLGES